MLSTGITRHLWDDSLELEAYICSHSANSLYYPDGKVPKMYMSRETADISQFCELACTWYNCIMYCIGTIGYPDEPLVPL